MTELLQMTGSADGAAAWIRGRIDAETGDMLARNLQAIKDEIARGPIQDDPAALAERRALEASVHRRPAPSWRRWFAGLGKSGR